MVDLAGEEAARGFLATAIKIGHGKVLLELVMHKFEFFLNIVAIRPLIVWKFQIMLLVFC